MSRPGREASQRPNFVITGGAGFFGINFTRFLLARGANVTSYDLAPFDYPERGLIREFRGDVRDRRALERALAGAYVVVHAAAALPLYRREEILSTNVGGVDAVLQVALAQGVKRVIYLSSTAVYGIPDHHPVTEGDPLEGVGPYGQSKIEAEKICLQYRRQGLCVPILRPKSFVGPERLGVFALLYEWAYEGHGFPVLGRGTNRYQLLDVEDLCEAVYRCSTLPPETVNDTFNIGAREFGTVREDYQAVLDRAGHGQRVRGIPARPVVWTLRVLEKLRLSPLYAWVYETAGKDSFVSIEKAERLLGFVPKRSNREALIRNYEWYVANLARFQNQVGVSHRVPWRHGFLAIVKAFF